MAVDPSKLRNSRRRGLGSPPTDGSPGIDRDPGDPSIYAAPGGGDATASQISAEPTPQLMAPATGSGQPQPRVGANGANDEEGASRLSRPEPAEGQGRGERPTSPQGRQRVPPPESESRIPFTTRVSASTKERLEDACHFLRVKHQDFINQAIVAHLKKHGF
jgi:hypothetical protein